MDPNKNPEQPCPCCGGRSYTWGDVYAHGMTFIPDSASILNKLFRYSQKLPARKCNVCENVQFFAKSPRNIAPKAAPDF